MDFVQKLEKAAEIHNNIKSTLNKEFLLNNTIIQIANHIEKEISNNLQNEINNGIAFPTGINIDNVVAHYTPSNKDNYFINDNNIVKIDYGVHVDGYIIDSAFSINYNEKYKSILDASESAIKNVIKNIGVDTKFQELSSIIEETVNSYEYEENGLLKPVKIINNVYGHNIKQFNIHGGKFLYPTVQKNDNQIVEEDDILAIEVFTSNGSGVTKLDHNLNNYSHYKLKPEFIERKIPLYPFKKLNIIGDLIKSDFKTLPFCSRFFKNIDVSTSNMQNLFRLGLLDSHPPLLECNSKSKSAQFEHTILVRESGVKDFNN
jgi:methionyl aminopeptidase|tara:strand:- start:48 stop:1001 length:954 start_codon:yes stop_codon:yes gene_type:complete